MSQTGVSRMTYREALRMALREELDRDDAVFLMGEEIGVFEGAYKITAGLLEAWGPDRVRDTPISEEGFVGAAIGAAMLGQRPVVEIMTLNFILVAMDQVQYAGRKAGFHTVVVPLQDFLVQDLRSTLYLLWGGVVFVLLVGAVNVTNLMLVRSSARMKELATRHALGAGLARIWASPWATPAFERSPPSASRRRRRARR